MRIFVFIAITLAASDAYAFRCNAERSLEYCAAATKNAGMNPALSAMEGALVTSGDGVWVGYKTYELEGKFNFPKWNNVQLKKSFVIIERALELGSEYLLKNQNKIRGKAIGVGFNMGVGNNSGCELSAVAWVIELAEGGGIAVRGPWRMPHNYQGRIYRTSAESLVNKCTK